jgi:bacteriocin-like protein
MTSQPSKPPIQAELSDSELSAVIGGVGKFRHVEQNGNTYAVGHVLGQTVKVKLT